MTKEDAVAIVSEIRSDYNFFDKNEQEEYHALSMAIEALQEQATLDDVSNAYENGYKQLLLKPVANYAYYHKER